MLKMSCLKLNYSNLYLEDCYWGWEEEGSYGCMWVDILEVVFLQPLKSWEWTCSPNSVMTSYDCLLFMEKKAEIWKSQVTSSNKHIEWMVGPRF